MRIRQRRVAVFDIDGTIFRSSLLIELVEALIAEKIFPPRARGAYQKAHREWLGRKDSYERYIEAVIVAFERHIRGVRLVDFERVVRQVLRMHRDRVYRFTRDLVRELKRKRYYLVAVSHSPKLVVHSFARRMGFDKIYGRMLEVNLQGRFTGRTLHEELIFDKAAVLRRAVAKEHLTLRGSVGVGDTESDIPFLKLVSRPICFNPNAKLYRMAKRRGWEVVVERKDVVYTMKNGNLKM